MIKTTSYDQIEIIENIINLYCPNGIELDPTYSKGVFYKKLKQPRYKFDTNPQMDDVSKGDARDMPFQPDEIKSIMFDPPFVGGTIGKGKKGIIKSRFGIYKDIPTLWGMYQDALKEFYRILVGKGVLIFKCQDSVEHNKQYMSEYKIIKMALEIGFYPKDKFILLAKNRLVSPSQRVQQHARKFHSYFLVFIKERKNIPY